MAETSGKAYRADLQGLRAIAVTMVLLFHFQLGSASGGFAGVDVFFVLSGYLMTHILLSTEQQPALRLVANFLIKRFWRIGPAYFATIILTLIIGWFVFLPLDYAKIAESALASSIFFSNEYFKNQTGYFEDAAVLKPLLHTWSLAVEMQFYLVWPLAYCIFRRFSLRLQGLVLVATIIVSFSTAMVFQQPDPDLTFFTLPTRLWQFALGALAANPWTLTQLKQLPIGNPLVQLASLAAIIGTTFLINEQMSWPAPWAMIPSIATLLLIVGGEKNSGTTGSLLSTKPMEWLGEISYSLYLIHWPIVCFAYVYWWPEPSVVTRLTLIITCIPLAWLMFRCVENPVRLKFKSTGATTKFHVSGGAVFLVSVVSSAFILMSAGVPNRYSAEMRPILMNQTAHHQHLKAAIDCTSTPNGCALNAEQTTFLWGDSHARTFRDGLAQIVAETGQNFAFQITDACPPAPEIWSRTYHQPAQKGCLRSNHEAIKKIQSIDNLSNVVLIGRWSLYTTTLGYSSNEREQRYVVSATSQKLSEENSKRTLKAALTTFIEDMSKRNVRVIFPMQVPEHRSDPARCHQYALQSGAAESLCSIPAKDVRDRQKSYRDMLFDLSIKHDNVHLIETKDAFCTEELCSAKLDGIIAYDDDDHLLPAAAFKVLQRSETVW